MPPMSQPQPRRVRFDPDPVSNVRLFPPSPASDVSSLPPSPGPSTPPPLPEVSVYTTAPRAAQYSAPSVYTTSPQGYPPNLSPPTFIPSPQAHSVYVNPALTAPQLAYDALAPPALTPHSHAPATSPPLPHLLLQSAQLPWSVAVAPSAGAFVSVHDVLAALHHALQMRVRSAEYKALPAAAQRPIKEAFEARCAGARHPAHEREAGLRRIDYLCTRTRIEGFARGPKEDVWLFSTR